MESQQSMDSIVTNYLTPAVTLKHSSLLKCFIEQTTMEKTTLSVELSNTIKRTFRKDLHFFKVTFVRELPSDSDSDSDSDTSCTKQLFSCTRTFEEVEKLQKCLDKKFVSVFVPPLSRQIGKGNDLDRKSKETLALTLFLNSLARHPFLKKSSIFLQFLTTKDKFTAEKCEKLLQERCEAHEKWTQFVELCALKKDPLGFSESVNEELSLLLRQYERVERDLVKYCSSLETQSKVFKRMKHVFSNWVVIEATKLKQTAAVASVSTPKNDAAEKAEGAGVALVENVSTSKVLKSTEEAFGSEEKELVDLNLGLKTLVAHDLSYELLNINCFKRELKKVKAGFLSWKKAKHAVEAIQVQLEHRKEKLRLTHDINQAAEVMKQGMAEVEPNTSDTRIEDSTEKDKVCQSLKTKIEELGKEEEKARATYHLIVKGILSIELNRFNFERSRRNATFFRKLSVLMSTKSQETAGVWKEYQLSIPSSIPSLSDLKILDKIDGSVMDSELQLPVRQTEHIIAQVTTADSPVDGTGEEPASDANSPMDEEENQDENSESDTEEEEDSATAQSPQVLAVGSSPPAVVNETSKLTLCKATSDFSKENEGERDLQSGEVVKGYYSSENPDWFWVENEGFVPSSHLQILRDDVQNIAEIDQSQQKEQIATAVPVGEKETSPNIPPAPPKATVFLDGIKGFNRDSLTKIVTS